MINPLKQGATIGILGGGQLGRMLSVAASRIGFKTHIFEPNKNPPASHVTHQITCADYSNTKALIAFANSVDIITYEFENIPTDALDTLENICSVLPNRNALATSQDRIIEKDFLNSLGLKTAPYANIKTKQDLDRALQDIATPAILKTRRFGYDGKGQCQIHSIKEAIKAWDTLKNIPCILEGFIDFTHEISVIGARSKNGDVVCYDPGQNIHVDGILHSTTLPAKLTVSQRTDAIILTGKILNALNYVGVMGVELFVTPQGILVNEIAPRVHNSGHWTQNGCTIDQFEQHIRAIAGWPLGDGKRHSNIIMTNLIGDDILKINDLAENSTIALHLYGKEDIKPGRKMGHMNKITGPS